MKFSIEYSILMYYILLIVIQLYFIINYFRKFAYQYFAGAKVTFCKKNDRILLFGSSIFFVLTLIIFEKLILEQNGSAIFMFLALSTILTTLSIFLFWKVKRELQTKDKSQLFFGDFRLDSESVDFKLNFSEDELSELFDKMEDDLLIENLILDSAISDQKLFVRILSQGKLPEEPIFKLNFDNIQTNLFYAHLKSREKYVKMKERLTLNKFLQIFKNKNPKATPSSISASTAKSFSEAKDKEQINSLFEFNKKG